MKVGILMGSPNDRDKMQPAADTLAKFGIEADVRVLSAHRNPAGVAEFTGAAREWLCRHHLRGGDGGASRRRGRGEHDAARRRCPAVKRRAERCGRAVRDGADAAGIPVATVAIDGSVNAALLVVQMLAISDADLAAKLADDRRERAAAS